MPRNTISTKRSVHVFILLSSRSGSAGQLPGTLSDTKVCLFMDKYDFFTKKENRSWMYKWIFPGLYLEKKGGYLHEPIEIAKKKTAHSLGYIKS